MIQIPRDYRISPERVPIPGASITEGVGIGDVLPEDSDSPRFVMERVNREEDKTLAYAALGLAGLALAIGGFRAAKHLRNKG